MKNWGPFNGRQLTTIILALIIGIVVIPAGAWAAVSFTNVAITDPGGVNRAKVSTGGAVSAAVTGNVTASPASPANLVRALGFAYNGSCTPFYTVPAGKALILSTATFWTRGYATAYGEVDLFRGTAGSCDDFIQAAIPTRDQTTETTQVDFGAGVAIKAGSTLSMSGYNAEGGVLLRGYLVAASAVPAASVSTTPAPEGALVRPNANG